MTNDIRKMNEVELKQVAGGVDGYHGLDPHGPWKRVSGLQTGWLALRSDYKYNSGNEAIYLRHQIKNNPHICGPGITWYTWVYSERLDKSGWVNSRFLAD